MGSSKMNIGLVIIALSGEGGWWNCKSAEASSLNI
jgi:hypothetical protein